MLRLLLLSDNPVTLALMRASMDALKGTLDAFDDAADLQRKLNKDTGGMPLGVVLDLARLGARGVRLANACTRVRQTTPAASVAVIASACEWLHPVVATWAREAGAAHAFARITPWRWAATGEALLAALTGSTEGASAMSRRIAPYLRAAAQTGGGRAAQRIAAAEAAGIDLGALAFRMQRSGGVAIADRSQLLRSHPECFEADEAIVWLERALRVDRERAIAIGQALQAADLIYHIDRAAEFGPGSGYFRVAQLPPAWSLEDFYAVIRSEAGFRVADRSVRGTRHERCFLGNEAVDWMLAQHYTLNHALTAGQRMLDASLAHHVRDEHPFRNEKTPYRFYRE